MNAFMNTAAAAPRASHGMGGRLNRVGAPVLRAGRWLREMTRRNAVINELDRLSDRELADIGLNRGDIRSVFQMSGRNGR